MVIRRWNMGATIKNLETSQIRRIGLICLLVFLACGCRSVKHDVNYWWNNNKKVGPNYAQPNAPVASIYSEFDSPKIDSSTIGDPQWWHVFNDPNLDLLIQEVYQQNLSLKAAAWRIAESRALSNIAAANLLPQKQVATGQYAHTQNSTNTATAVPGFPLTIDDWSVGFDASWELDLWGRVRRSIDAADAQVCASVCDYDFALVTLVGDVASLYVQICSLDERLELAKQNVELQEGSLGVARKRFKEGRTSKLDVVQAESNVASTRSTIPQLELVRRQSLNALAVLMGIPPSEITAFSTEPGKIPEIPSQAIVGIPAELICRRPDIRSAERLMAAQFEQIGIAEADLYPTFALSGTLGYQASKLSDLYKSSSYTGTVAPGFSWKVLNYGRLRNNVRAQEARFKQICFDYKNKVLQAQREVEDGIIEFIKSSEQYEFDKDNEAANREAVKLANALYIEGKQDFGRVFVVQSNLVLAQDKLVTTRANIALALIKTYKSLGGGWEIRCQSN